MRVELLPRTEWDTLLRELRGGIAAALVRFRRQHRGWIEPAVFLAALRELTRELRHEAQNSELMRESRSGWLVKETSEGAAR